MTTFDDSPRPAKKRKIASPTPHGEVPSGDALESLRKTLSTVSPTTLDTFKTSLLRPITRQHLARDNAFTEDEHEKVHSLLSQTVLAGEGNSMLVIGSRGSGKSSLVESVISDLSRDHRDDFHVVRLNGFIHTDDKLALREIWRQLGREMEVEDETSGRSNYADALTSLLALLSHTPENTDPDNHESEPEGTAKAVVFILSEFDLFASHPRQTLLYNLFDIAQSRNAPIAVLGLTTKISVVESLEKRVKSRFGQRFIHLSLPGRSFSTFTSMCKTALQPPKTAISASLQLSESVHSELDTLNVAWRRYLDHLFITTSLLTHLRTIHSTTASLPAFLISALVPLSLLSSTCIPTAEAFTTHSLAPPDSKRKPRFRCISNPALRPIPTAPAPNPYLCPLTQPSPSPKTNTLKPHQYTSSPPSPTSRSPSSSPPHAWTSCSTPTSATSRWCTTSKSLNPCPEPEPQHPDPVH